MMHLFAISGLHIALIAGILVSLLRVFRVPRAACGLLSLPLFWFYTLATGWQASAIRSAIMMSVIIVGWSLARPSALVNSLAAAALIILSLDPLQLFQAGFQLSFLVVLGLALLSSKLEDLRRRWRKPDPLRLAAPLSRARRCLRSSAHFLIASVTTSLAAWLGSMPLIAHYFSLVTPGCVPANVVIVPLGSLALMSSLGSLLCGDWLASVGVLFNHAAWFWMRCMVELSRWFAAWPGAYWYVRPPSALDFLCYYVLLAGVVWGWFFSPRWRAGSITLTAVCVSACLFEKTRDQSQTEITVLPNRAGTVFVDEPGTSNDLLFDCGDTAAFDNMVKPFLRSRGVDQLPGLVLSHGAIRQMGAAELMLERRCVKRVYTSSAVSRSPVYRHLLGQLAFQTNRWQKLNRGDQIGSWTVLHPSPADQARQAADAALVLRSEFAGVRVTWISSLGRSGQVQLLQREADLATDVLIAAMPSDPDGWSQRLLSALQPRLLIIGCAERPASAHPNRALRERLASLQVPFVDTSETGAARILLQKGHWTVHTMWPRPPSPAQIPEVGDRDLEELDGLEN